MFEIAQPTVDQLGRGRGGAAREIAAFEQQHLRPAPGGIARDPAAVDAAADHREVVHRFPPPQRMARPAGFEPATTSLEGSCSIQLSYGRALFIGCGTGPLPTDRKSTRLNSSH